MTRQSCSPAAKRSANVGETSAPGGPGEQGLGGARLAKRDVRDDLAPDVRGGRVGVQEERVGSAGVPCLAVGHRRIQDVEDVHRGAASALKTVSNAIALKRSSAAEERSTFIRRIAPSHVKRWPG